MSSVPEPPPKRVEITVSVRTMATILGVVGALIAVPLTASVQIVVRELTAERRAAVALAHAAVPGRPDADQ